jgi:ribosome biogenesis GTPase A
MGAFGSRYKAHRDNVIDLMARYSERAATGQLPTMSRSIVDQVGCLKDGKFTLVIAGESNSGKSTFINALLGRELLLYYQLKPQEKIL